MERTIVCVLFLLSNKYVASEIDVEINFLNRTNPAERQLYDFNLIHPEPVGVLTTSSGFPVDIRDTFSINKNQYINDHNFDLLKHLVNNRIPERVVHAKGTGAYGYFIVDNDVTKYTSADLFSEVKKITPVFGRFSVGPANLGGTDLDRDIKALAIKFYTKEGNLDFVCINFPVYFYKDSINFVNFNNAFQRNPKTNLRDFTARWDFITQKPELLAAMFWQLSDYGIPNGYRKMDYFPIHAYELQNKLGQRYFAKFNIRTEQGLENLGTSEAMHIAGRDPDYYTRDLYNAIEEKNYPVFRLEMYIMTYEEILKLNYDPFDVTRLWQKGTYKTVNVGRLIFNQNLDNWFENVRLSAFNPANLVPGIPGPIDSMFRGRMFAYRDAHNHRLGINHNRIPVNTPFYRKEYNRDGKPPVSDNMKDAPEYYPNSFSGPIPYVDINRPKDSLSVLHTKSVDLEEPTNFYNNILTDEQRDRFINNTLETLFPVAPYLQQRSIKLLTLVDPNFGCTLAVRLKRAERNPDNPPPKFHRASRKTHYFLNHNGNVKHH